MKKYTIVITNVESGEFKNIKMINHDEGRYLAITSNPQNEYPVFESDSLVECRKFFKSNYK